MREPELPPLGKGFSASPTSLALLFTGSAACASLAWAGQALPTLRRHRGGAATYAPLPTEAVSSGDEGGSVMYSHALE